ncbi:GntR family transcriptional regulator [Aestuariimicrobium sp. p3-SID1156]|uniref:GntR family transcriptional regulator n=1 Tax=Aestuariimicrobium sp. p3-SID1156 TaxID=2916038 RepID=UPI00223C4A30|nr:GntR family transcriptional regulator [Aestuariimicrobium sp. p3-SID1156]MCT1458106.1 GntR family transcriptional regulator [Aestuariimicrobium sp. p3-SID1156]
MALAIHIRPDDPTPPFEQLRSQIEAAIATGALAAGTRIPPVRQLARDLGIAPGTVARAYKELESAGLVATARGAGTTVTGRPERVTNPALAELTAEYVAAARRLRASDLAISDAIARALTL